MPAIAAGDVTYTVTKREFVSGGEPKKYYVTIVFGDATLTYDATGGGVPLTRAKLGCPNVLQSLLIIDAAHANGFVYKYNPTTEKIRIYQGDNNNSADAPLIELLDAATPAAATLKVVVEGY